MAREASIGWEVDQLPSERSQTSVVRDGHFWTLLAGGLIAIASFRVLCFTPTYPVHGRLLMGSEPAAEAVLEFHRLGDRDLPNARPRAHVRQDGSFELVSGVEQVGAAAGTYAVTVVWREAIDSDEGGSGPNRAPEPYSRRESTPLQVTVVAGNNRLPPLQIGERPPWRWAPHPDSRKVEP